jgi:hypothetical protein
MLGAIREAGTTMQEILLAPLGLDDLGRLVADALHCEQDTAQPLAQLILERTGGNPFFSIQFFTTLADSGLVWFDPVTRAWQWDMHRIHAKSYSDNVVDLMAGKLKRLPIGKLQLYTACAGVPPQYLSPMYLDAGTNNEQYLHDQLYLGMRKTRPTTEELYSFVDEFVDAVQDAFPKCCIHFEDWTGTDAVHLLQRYRDKYCVYNDDVQGTALIILAGMINATNLKGIKLKDEKYLFFGAGSAGTGLANLLCSALVAQGLTLKEAQSRVYMFDINGLLDRPAKILLISRRRTHTSTRQPGISWRRSRVSSQRRSSA